MSIVMFTVYSPGYGSVRAPAMVASGHASTEVRILLL